MTSYKRPGVFVEESLQTRNPSTSSAVSAAVFVAPHQRGPTEPTLVRSFSDFSRHFGGFPARNSLLPYSVFEYFNNGGRDAYILRVLGNDGTVATVELNDSYDDPEGTGSALPTLRVDAANPGDWGANLRVGITHTTGTEDEFTLLVYYGGVSSSHIVERYTGLTMNPNDSRYVETVINSENGSAYIQVEDLESDNVGTAGAADEFALVRPAEGEGDEAVALTGGSWSEPSTEEMADALDKLDEINRVYVVNFPGAYSTTVINAAITKVEQLGRGFLVVDTPPELDAEGAGTFADSLQTSSYAATYWPYIHVSDAGVNSASATRLMPPGGAVCGRIVSTDTSDGVWKAPAGLGARIAGAVGTEARISSHDLDLLTEHHVNPILHRPGAGFVVWGARTLKKSRADKYVPIRRSLIYIKRVLQESTAWALFEPNDRELWSALEGEISTFLTGLWHEGGLRGETPEEAFFVKADEDINTAEDIASGLINIEVGVALQYPAEFIVIKLSQWEGGGSSTEVA